MATPAVGLRSHEHDIMLMDFLQVIDHKVCADVVFVVQGKTLGGFRNVLSLRCKALGGMLSGQFKETCSSGEPIHLNYASEVFRAFLIYLHTGGVYFQDVIEAMELYSISDFFIVNELKAKCIDFVREVHVTEESVIKMLTFAMKFNFLDIIEKVVDCIARLADAVLLNSNEAAQLPTRFLKFLFSASDVSVSEVILLRIALELKSEEDAGLQAELLGHIRLPRLNAKDMVDLVRPSGLFDADAIINAMAFQMDARSVSLTPKSVAARVCRESSEPRRTDLCKGKSQGRGIPAWMQPGVTTFAKRFVDMMQDDSRDPGNAEEVDQDMESCVDESGIEPKDLDLIMSQVSCSRQTAARMLRMSNHCIVTAIMRIAGDHDENDEP